MDTNDLAKRMKEYEKTNRHYLKAKMPVILRLDMRAGHSFCKGFKRPFDEIFIKSMQETAKYLCENISGCKLSYQQSDEITLVLVDYEKVETQPWFDYRTDKLCSIAASMATLAFNKYFWKNTEAYIDEHYDDQYEAKYINTLEKSIEKGAMFDCRCFNIPKEEVTNCIYWRQLDATRNSVQMVGQANFSHKELQHKTCKMIKDMLMTQKGINWDDLPTYQKFGSCCIKDNTTITCASTDDNGEVKTWATQRPHWIIDREIPVFKDEGREYIERLINFK